MPTPKILALQRKLGKLESARERIPISWKTKEQHAFAQALEVNIQKLRDYIRFHLIDYSGPKVREDSE